MRIDFEGARIYVRPGSTDLRKGVTGLAEIIENEMRLSALSESVFLFCNKNHKLLKVIFWDRTGFWTAQKRRRGRHGRGGTRRRRQKKSQMCVMIF